MRLRVPERLVERESLSRDGGTIGNNKRCPRRGARRYA